MHTATATRLLPVLLLFVFFAAPAHAQVQTLGVYVANQGNFTGGTGSVTFYDPETEQTDEVLENINTIIQSITLHDGRLYVLSSTGNAVDVLDLATHERVGQIPDVTNPRYLAIVDEDKAYVTSQVYRYGGVTDKSFVSIIDLATSTVSDTLEVPGQPDGLVVVGNRAYVALGTFGESRLVGVIDTETDALVDLIDVDCTAPRYLTVDAEDEVHVICNGSGELPGALVTLDGATGAVLGRIEATTTLGTGATGQDASFARSLDALFVVAGQEILRFDTENRPDPDDEEQTLHLVPSDTLAIAGSRDIGGVAYDDGTNRLYLSRPAGYTSFGSVTVHALDGTEADAFQAAYAPVHIAFHQTGTPVAAEPPAETPAHFGLQANYPNPFNPATMIPFALTEGGPVTLKIYNALGAEVATLVEGTRPAGSYAVRWDAGRLASGVYVARLQAGGRFATRRLVLLK